MSKIIGKNHPNIRITKEYINGSRFDFISDIDISIIIKVYSKEHKEILSYEEEMDIKKNINYYTSIYDTWFDKVVKIYDKNTSEKYLEFEMFGEKTIPDYKIKYNKTEELYIDLLKKSLIDYIDNDNDGDHCKIEGKDINDLEFSVLKTMIGLMALDNIEYCIDDIKKNNIEGDFLEAGVWRGGATIFMKALSEIFNMNKKVWVADAFESTFPLSEKKYSLDNDVKWQDPMLDKLKVSLDEVKENFNKYNLLDNNVKFLKGWFEDTLHTPEIKKLSLLRLDGDMYSSTIQTMDALYHKLEIGGYIIIDDYNALLECKSAITDYRKQHNITEEIIRVNWACVYWKKLK